MNFVLILLCGMQLVSSQIEIRPLKSNGVLFEPIGPALLYQTKWTILTKLTIIHPEKTLEFVKRCEITANNLCNVLKDQKENCQTWHQEISTMMKKIETQLGELDFYLGKGRKRRELFDGVGKLSKYLFGTMDSEDSKQVFSRLQTLEKHDEENMHLMQKQVTVLKSSFDSTSKQIQNLTLHQNYLIEMVQNFTTRLATDTVTMKQDIQKIKIQSEINHILLFIWTKLQLVHDHISDQFTVINALHEHRLHPLLISAKQFNNTYNQITNSKTGYLSIKQFALLNQVVEVQSYEGESGLIIRITIPLILDQEFILQRVHLIPVTSKTRQTTIVDIQTNYVLNGTQNQYIELSQYELTETCKRCLSNDHNNILICQQRQPKNLHNNKRDCLSSLLVSSENETVNQCQHKILSNHQDMLVKLMRKDTWLFSFETTRKIIAYCGKATLAKELIGTGILQLTTSCAFTLDAKEIPFEGNNEITLPFHQPEIQPPNFKVEGHWNETINNQPNNKNWDIKIQPYQSNNKELLDNAQSISDLEKELNNTQQRRELEKRSTQTNMNSGILGIITFIIVIIIIKQLTNQVKKCCQKQKTKTTQKTLSEVREVYHIPEIHLEQIKVDPITKHMTKTERKSSVKL